MVAAWTQNQGRLVLHSRPRSWRSCLC